ncbi:MAG: Flp family type IVb pilin [Parasphingopyxis sp.]|uniref:Flp family type IVb pilin n=1 Tax=Parasphingopyxis sp. TaxID=1920299 RepID=UPI003FA06B07
MTGRFLHDERGATAIEYGLIAALISLAAILAFTSLGLNLADVFNTISNAMR